MAPDCAHNTTGLAFVATQEFLVTYCLTFVCFILFVVPFRVHFTDISQRLFRLHTFTGIFVKTLCIWNITIGLYWAAPSSINEPESKETLVPTERPEPTTEATSAGDILVSQVTPLLGITPHENTQLQCRNTPEDVADILGTRAFQRYVKTPLQTLDGITVNQPKHFLPFAKEAKRIAEEIIIEKINEQWAGIPQEQLLNQSFSDQLNLIQILEQLAPL